MARVPTMVRAAQRAATSAEEELSRVRAAVVAGELEAVELVEAEAEVRAARLRVEAAERAARDAAQAELDAEREKSERAYRRRRGRHERVTREAQERGRQAAIASGLADSTALDLYRTNGTPLPPDVRERLIAKGVLLDPGERRHQR